MMDKCSRCGGMFSVETGGYIDRYGYFVLSRERREITRVTCDGCGRFYGYRPEGKKHGKQKRKLPQMR